MKDEHYKAHPHVAREKHTWLWILIMHHCDKMWYPYIINKLFGRHIPIMLRNKLEEYMCFLPLHNLQQPLPHLICGCFNFFTFVIKVINDKWVPCHVIIGLFETPSTFGTTLAKHVKSLTITWRKKMGKRKQEWELACKEVGLRWRKLKIHLFNLEILNKI